jgi:hypothetical protein
MALPWYSWIFMTLSNQCQLQAVFEDFDSAMTFMQGVNGVY